MNVRSLTHRVRRRWQLLATSLLVPFLGITFIGVGGTDDVYITLGAARQLATSGFILNYNGERLEQSSSLLHVMLLAFASRTTHLPLPWLAWGIGILAGMGTVVMVGLLADRVRPGTALTTSMLTALATPFLYWSVGSLETPIAALLLTATAYTSLGLIRSSEPRWWRRTIAPAVAIGLFAMVRPEGGPLLILGFAIAFVLLRRMQREDVELRNRSGRRLLQLAGLAAVAAAALAALRLACFGRAVPQPVWAKTSLSFERFGEGLSYVVHSIDPSLGVLLILAVLGIWSLRHRWTDGAALIAALLIAATLVVIASGGDWMGFGRFLTPSLPLLAVFAAIGLRSLEHRSLAVTAVVTLMLLGGAVHLSAESMGTPIWTRPVWSDSGVEPVSLSWVESQYRVHIRDATAAPVLARIVDSLADSQVDTVRVGSMQAGAVVFHSRFTEHSRFRFVDTLSLSTDEFSHCSIARNHTKFGYGVGITPWFDGRKTCGVPPPEVLLMLDCTALEANTSTYRIVWRTGGTFESGPFHTPGPTGQCIGVREDHVGSLPLELQPGPR